MKALLGMTKKELEETIKALGQPAFRAAQIMRWQCDLTPFEDMSNLPLAFREKLAETCREGYGCLKTRLVSKDGTKKYLFELNGGDLIETVLMTYEHGNTVCISTQAGCAMGCAFCASCKNGLSRNLTAGELLYQVLFANKDAGGSGADRRISNIVLMGTGEPLANYDNVIKFLRLINSEDTLGISYRNISLSTCGLVPQMEKLAGEGMPIVLCLSLHAAFEEKRRSIMPIAEKYTIKEALGAMQKWSLKTGRRVIIEYILLHGINDGAEDIKELVRLLAPLKCHVNLIVYNGIAESDFNSPNRAEAYLFADELNKGGVSATVRRSLGQDIAGACGQLRSAHLSGGTSGRN